MNVCIRLIVCISIVLMTSCGYYGKFVDNAREKKACHLQCLNALDKCKIQCKNNCRECNVLANMQAASRFIEYKKRQSMQGKMVNEELQSFKDPLQCRKVTCSCQEDYRVCKQSCIGKVYKYLKANPAC